jgi:hypothetical protein
MFLLLLMCAAAAMAQQPPAPSMFPAGCPNASVLSNTNLTSALRHMRLLNPASMR